MEEKKKAGRYALGGVVLEFVSDLPLTAEKGMQTFATADAPDVTVQVRNGCPSCPCRLTGQDMLLNYYEGNGFSYAAARHGLKQPAMVTIYTSDYTHAEVYLNERDFPGVFRTVDRLLQLFPIRRLLANYSAMVLHSSRIEINAKAILFTAPSQTGKTTQARLWHQWEKAPVLGNDRTLLRMQNGDFYTYGYPVDGSSPVYRDRMIPLGAAVVLQQGTENRIERLRPLKALKYLMEQTVADVWDAEEMVILQELWLELLERYPVYRLTCLPDYGAVACLKERLMREGVMENA